MQKAQKGGKRQISGRANGDFSLVMERFRLKTGTWGSAWPRGVVTVELRCSIENDPAAVRREARTYALLMRVVAAEVQR